MGSGYRKNRTMMPTKVNILILILLNICAIYAENAAVFTAERRIDQYLLPLPLKDKTLFTYFTGNDTIVTSFGYFGGNATIPPGQVQCKIPGIIPPDRDLLGNGKVVAATYVHSHFTILDYKNCSSYTTIPIDDGKPYAWDDEKQIELVVPYDDTFDIFDKSGQTCLPCRYNDKGEKIEVTNKLKQDEEDHKGYFLEPIKKELGPNGEYLYGFSFKNGSAVVKILDSKYNTLKEHDIGGEIVGRAIVGDKFIIFYIVPKGFWGYGSMKCQILDQNLNTVKTIEMHKPRGSFDSITSHITNLADGGVMVALEYFIFNLGSDNDHDMFIQQIHADGTVEPATHFGNIKDNYVGIRSFVTDSGEYCLVAAVDHKGKGDYSVMKCVVPRTIQKS